MKKIIALLVAVIFIFSAFCGCSAKNETNENTAKETDQTEETNETKTADQTEAPDEDKTTDESSTTITDKNTDDPTAAGAQKGNYIFTPDNYPKMGGSLANLPLGEAVTATVLGITRDEADKYIRFEGSTTDNYKMLVDGTFDILLAYEPSEEAKAYIEDADVPLEMTPIGVDALVFICSRQNKVNSLTTAQIKDIYSGKLTSWADVGGENSDIIPYQRNKDSGSQTLFDKLINLGDDLMEPKTDYVIGEMLHLLEVIADYDNSRDALGYTVYYYLTNMEKDKLSTSKILDIDGVTPSNETIGSGEYPLTNDFYVVIRKSAGEDSPERILYNWICSEQGSELVARENYPVKQ